MSFLSWGANSYGQLGLGHCTDTLSPTVVKTPANTVQIHAGGGHTLVITQSGECYGCGSNSHGQLAFEKSSEPQTAWRAVDIPGKAHSSSLGWDFTFIILDNNSLVAFGANTFGQLGLGEGSLKSVSLPTEIHLKQKVVQVSCGLRHTLVVTDCGEVFGCGNNKKGQLAHSAKRCPSFVGVELSSDQIPVMSVAAGAYHSTALSRTGKVLLWGCNKHGQMALDPSKVTQSKPVIVSDAYFDSEKISQLHSGWTHLLAITASGKVFTWGRYDYGQLGRDVDTPHYVPGVVALNSPAVMAACGSEHNLVVSSDETCFAWGWNEHGMCGTGDEVNVSKPTLVENITSVELVASGAGHSFRKHSSKERE